MTDRKISRDDLLKKMIDQRKEMLDALMAAHQDVDVLLAHIATLEKTFMPTKSIVWPNVVKRHALLSHYRRFD